MDTFDSLLTQSSGRRVSAEELEMLGRKASSLFQQQGVPLNQAITQVIKDHPELGNEHVKRIVEFANTVTFQELFQKSEDKNVHFDVADPGVVLRDLKDGGSPAHDGKTLSGGMGDYSVAPQQENNPDDAALAQMFNPAAHQPQADGGQELAKLASAPTDNSVHANPIEDVYDAHVRLQAARSELAGAHEQFDLLQKHAHDELERAIKREALSEDGAGLGGVLSVLEKLASKELVASVVGPMIEKMARDTRTQEPLLAGLEKRAGKVINPGHPIVVAWSGLVKAAEDKVRTAEALSEVDGHLKETTAFLKNAGALATGLKDAVGITGKVPNGLRQRFPKAV